MSDFVTVAEAKQILGVNQIRAREYLECHGATRKGLE